MGQTFSRDLSVSWQIIITTLQAMRKSEILDNPTLAVVSTARDTQDCSQRAAQADNGVSVQAARPAHREVEECVREGIQPVIMPTMEQVAAAKAKVQYQDGLFHFAVAGIAGSGKSSLINAFRGLPNNHRDAARTGVVETTSSIGRYPDPKPEYPFVWYDIPGAGTLAQPDWEYFNNQGLFVFDCIIVLFDSRFTETDAAILTNCKRFQIPTYIVRAKADIHIDNIISDIVDPDDNEDEDEDSNEGLYQSLYVQAREQFVAATRATVASNLGNAGLPDQRVYCISKKALLSMKRGRLLPEVIDEVELIKDILEEARSRRCVV